MNVLRTKPIQSFLNDIATSHLKKTLTAVDITLLGIGVIVGTGIFVLTGVVAAQYAGPGIILSFILAGITCAFVAMAYSELSATLPVAGSAYTYTYGTLGELAAWTVGWGLVAEYSIGAAAVSVGWSAYVSALLASGGIHLPKILISGPAEGGLINLPAMIIVWVVTLLLVRGIQESARVNRVLVIIKLSVIFLFLCLAGPQVQTINWQPFLPFGWSGVYAGASVIFFAYIGFDCLSATVEEAKNPQRDVPIGIISALVICTILYIAVSAVLTGVIPYQSLNNAEPVTFVLRQLGYNFGSALVATGALCGLSTVILVLMYSQTRAFYAMSRDGLLPKFFGEIHPRFSTPAKVTLLIGVVISLLAGLTPINIIAELTSAGTLFAFLCASLSVMILRKRHPELPRSFKCPNLYAVATLGFFSTAFLLYNLSFITHAFFFSWIFFGIIVYFIYGHHHSHLSPVETAQTTPKSAENN